MTIKFPNKKTPILYQGITASSGSIHVEKAIFYGSNVVAGVSKDKSVTMFQNVPVFQTVKEAVKNHKLVLFFQVLNGRFKMLKKRQKQGYH